MALHRGPKIVTDGLVLCLDAADKTSYSGSGTTWYDRSADNLEATLKNGASFSTDAGGCIDFDGIDDFGDLGSCPTNLQMAQTSSFTITAWIRLDTDGVTNPIMGAWRSTGNAGYGLSCRCASYNNVLSFITSDGADGSGYWVLQYGDPTADKTPEMTTGRWYHVAITISRVSGTTTIYYHQDGFMNPNAKTFTNEGGATAWGNGRNLTVGAWELTFFDGQVASVLIYDRVLSDAEVLNNFNAMRGRFGV